MPNCQKKKVFIKICKYLNLEFNSDYLSKEEVAVARVGLAISLVMSQE